MNAVDDLAPDAEREAFLAGATNEECRRMLAYLIGRSPKRFDQARSWIERTRVGRSA